MEICNFPLLKYEVFSKISLGPIIVQCWMYTSTNSCPSICHKISSITLLHFIQNLPQFHSLFYCFYDHQAGNLMFTVLIYSSVNESCYIFLCFLHFFCDLIILSYTTHAKNCLGIQVLNTFLLRQKKLCIVIVCINLKLHCGVEGNQQK